MVQHRVGTILLFPLLAITNVAAAQTRPSTFEVASVRPSAPQADPNTGSWSIPGSNRFIASHVSLARLIQLAYNVDDSQIANKPSWLETNLYDVNAKAEDEIHLSREELRPRLQDLLHQRFHLVAHTDTRLVRGYALVVAKGGPHLTPTKSKHFPGFRINVESGEMWGENWSLAQLAKYLTPAAGFPVVDETGISGSYDIGFSYASRPDVTTTLPPLDVAVKQATGLMLKPQTVPVATIVIDTVDEVPTAN